MFEINNEIWHLAFVPAYSSILIRNDGMLTVGMCDDRTKTIYISEEIYGDFFKEVLCHEIVHAAMFSYDVMLTEDQEELIAQVIAEFGEEIIDITNQLFYKLRGRHF